MCLFIVYTNHIIIAEQPPIRIRIAAACMRAAISRKHVHIMHLEGHIKHEEK